MGLKEIIADKSIPDTTALTINGTNVTLGELRGHFTEENQRITTESQRLQQEIAKAQKQSEEAAQLYSQVVALQQQLPIRGPATNHAMQGDELAAYLEDPAWNPVVSRIVALEKMLNDRLTAFNASMQTINSYLAHEHMSREYDMNAEAFGDLGYPQALAEAQKENLVDPLWKTPSLKLLAQRKREETKRQNQASTEFERGKKEGRDAYAREQAAASTTTPAGNLGAPGMFRTKVPKPIDRHNPFAESIQQAATDPEIVGRPN